MHNINIIIIIIIYIIIIIVIIVIIIIIIIIIINDFKVVQERKLCIVCGHCNLIYRGVSFLRNCGATSVGSITTGEGNLVLSTGLIM